MNRQKFIVHLALALMLVVVAGIAGMVRRWQQSEQRDAAPTVEIAEPAEAPPVGVREDEEGSDAADVLVRFKPGLTEEQIEAIAGHFNDSVDDRVEAAPGLVAIDDLDGASADAVVADYSRLPEVEYVEKNEAIRLDPDEYPRGITRYLSSPPAAGAPDDPMLGEQWALINTGQREGRAQADVDALAAWAKTHGSDEVVVAVLDTGVDYTHLDLMNNVWLRPDGLAAYADAELGELDDEYGFNAVDNLADPMDDNGHGTHCAGIVGAEGDNGEGIAGVNWKVKIMPLKFMDKNGMGTTKNAIEAINYAIARKKDGVNIRVISASWGSTRRSRALEDVIRKAGEAGILFVAAAGNSSQNTDRNPHYPSSYQLPNVVAVAALNRRDELASFSNYGAKTVHVAAPGAEILSTWPGARYEEHSGTSMATPLVAGVAALALSADKDLTVAELKARVLESVDKLPALEGKVATGGRVNAARAVGAQPGR